MAFRRLFPGQFFKMNVFNMPDTELVAWNQVCSHRNSVFLSQTQLVMSAGGQLTQILSAAHDWWGIEAWSMNEMLLAGSEKQLMTEWLCGGLRSGSSTIEGIGKEQVNQI